jgi:hypothetical protein
MATSWKACAACLGCTLHIVCICRHVSIQNNRTLPTLLKRNDNLKDILIILLKDAVKWTVAYVKKNWIYFPPFNNGFLSCIHECRISYELMGWQCMKVPTEDHCLTYSLALKLHSHGATPCCGKNGVQKTIGTQQLGDTLHNSRPYRQK